MLSSCMMDAPARLVREYKQEKRHECSAFSHQRFLCADLCAENYLQILVDYWKFAAKIVVDWKFLKRSDLVILGYACFQMRNLYTDYIYSSFFVVFLVAATNTKNMLIYTFSFHSNSTLLFYFKSNLSTRLFILYK